MFSAAITIALLSIMLSIIVGLVISALCERRRTLKYQQQTATPTTPLKADVTLVVCRPDGTIFGVQWPAPVPIFTLPSSWYTRRRTLISLAFLLMTLLTLFVQAGLTDGLQAQIARSITFLSYNPPTDLHTEPHAAEYTTNPLTASQLLVRVDSADRNQYSNNDQYGTWSYSSCSGIAMEMVMNAYGRHLIAADILQEELNLGVWSVSGGLLREQGITLTANYFGFNASLSHSRTFDDILALSNKGFPVIVSVRDNYYFPGGHIFVVRGADSQTIYIADSSPANFQHMTRALFLNMWQGQSFSALLTPR